MENEWDNQIEIIGFVKSANLANAPSFDHHFIVRDDKTGDNRTSDENYLLNMLCSALQIEDSVAICRLNAYTYGTICPIR